MLVDLYDTIAPDYDSLHGRWLRHAGGEAQAAFEGAATGLLRPGMRVVDVGCGTGEFARRFMASCDFDADFTLVDPSTAMLAQSTDLPVRRARRTMDDLPLPDNAFDLVTCAWALETTPDPEPALAELLRVTRVGGNLLLVFCAQRHGIGPMAHLMRQALLRRGTGRFLNRGHVTGTLTALGARRIRNLPCGGPNAVILCEKGWELTARRKCSRSRAPS